MAPVLRWLLLTVFEELLLRSSRSFVFFYLENQSKKTKSRNRHDGGGTTRTSYDTFLNHFPQSLSIGD